MALPRPTSGPMIETKDLRRTFKSRKSEVDVKGALLHAPAGLLSTVRVRFIAPLAADEKINAILKTIDRDPLVFAKYPAITVVDTILLVGSTLRVNSLTEIVDKPTEVTTERRTR